MKDLKEGAMPVTDIINWLKDAGYMVTQDAFKHLVGDHYSKITDRAAKAKLRFHKHRYKDGILPAVNVMETFLTTCGATMVCENWWTFPATEETGGQE